MVYLGLKYAFEKWKVKFLLLIIIKCQFFGNCCIQ